MSEISLIEFAGIYTHKLMLQLLFVFPYPAYGLFGLARGGQQVSKCKEVFGKAVKLLVELASLQVGLEL